MYIRVWRYLKFDHKIFNTIEQPAERKRYLRGGGGEGGQLPGLRFKKSGSIPRFSHGKTVNDDCVPSHSQECIVR